MMVYLGRMKMGVLIKKMIYTWGRMKMRELMKKKMMYLEQIEDGSLRR